MAEFVILLGLYFAFLNLAKNYRRSRWKTVLAGILVYIIANVFIILILIVYKTVKSFETGANSLPLTSLEKLIGYFLSIGLVYLFYSLLRKRFIQDQGDSPQKQIEKIGTGEY